MQSDVTRSIKAGVGAGLIAGVVLAIAELTLAAIGGAPIMAVFRGLASVFLGLDALTLLTPAATAVVIGLICHLILSAMFGLFYGVYSSALTMPTRRSFGRQAVVGPLYGLMLWLINFHVFARFRYPWLLELPQAPQAFLHAATYGLPLGLVYARAERRTVDVARYRIRFSDWIRPARASRASETEPSLPLAAELVRLDAEAARTRGSAREPRAVHR